ncbi:MAG: A24 family peptidase [Selenomonadaceae bacterium]|nr:A24 family peptidase [Selenomonadaceae bacterium]
MSDSKILFHCRYQALAIMTVLFCCLHLQGNFTAEAITAAVFLSITAAVDLRFGLILDRVSAAFFVAVTLLKLGTDADWTGCLLSGAAAGGFFLLLRQLSGGGLGLGDVKLAALLGWWLGPERCLLAIILSFITAVPVALALLLGGRYGWRSALPFGPFLALGAWLSFLFHGEIYTFWSGL